MVTGVLTHAAAAYTKTTGKVPVLFLDGVDLLAKSKNLTCKVFICCIFMALFLAIHMH